MPCLKAIFAMPALLISTLACSTIMGGDISETNEVPLFKGAISCSTITDQIIERVASGSYRKRGNMLDEEKYLVYYNVSGDEIFDPYFFEDVDEDMRDEQNDLATHQQVWKYFSTLIPADQRKIVFAYSIFTDGQDGTLAAVSQTHSNANLWVLLVDIADTRNYYDLTFTLVHELGHLLTLGPSQVPPSWDVFKNPDDNDIYLDEVAACPQYFPGEGCANPDSYINAFYGRFWMDIHEEWDEINLEEDKDSYDLRLNNFYNKYQGQFVTHYAATNPSEDIAESWAFFVLGSKPASNTLAEQKVLFFYQYPELVKLREQILTNLCGSFPK
jgi:hypothetical protein